MTIYLLAYGRFMSIPDFKFWHDVRFYIVTAVIGVTLNSAVGAYQKQSDTLQNVSIEVAKINEKLDDSNLIDMRSDINRNEYRITSAEKRVERLEMKSNSSPIK